MSELSDIDCYPSDLTSDAYFRFCSKKMWCTKCMLDKAIFPKIKVNMGTVIPLIDEKQDRKGNKK